MDKKLNKVIKNKLIQNSPIKDLLISKLEGGDRELLVYFDNNQKLPAFFLLKDLLTEKQQIRQFKSAWTCAELNYKFREPSIEMFRKYGKQMMTPSEIRFLDLLPEKVRIYRGTRVAEHLDNGISWTLDEDIAKRIVKNPNAKFWEMMEGRSIPFEENIITKVIDKKSILCYNKSRNEKEVIYVGGVN